MKTKNIAIFASGAGTNAVNLYEYFKSNPQICIKKLVCNKPQAKVLEKFKGLNTEIILINKEEFSNHEILLKKLEDIDLIILAGFLWLIPPYLIKAFPDKIINLHPSLLPKFGGKGMYGMNVHQAVINANEEESGITIHLVNAEYDKGRILHQAKCKLDKNDTPEILAYKIDKLEKEFLPKVVEDYLLSH